ncbi:transglycosylase domain-containing protein [Hyphomicrobium sp.]|uniref:transglycosylase domain-containing protein n=1 Tax=Hyphomicrobium sp. TaxID=82 RepID=UPI003F71D275
MSDWFFKRGRRDGIDWMALDSRLDSSVSEFWSRAKDIWDAGSSFFARFKLTGGKRLVTEAASEGFTLAVGGFFVLYALALPAFLDFDEGRFLTGQYSVKFLDAGGNEIGQRGILHNDAVPLEEIPDSVIKATLATEDRRFFEHFGIDVLGTARALVENLRANDVVQGGSSLSQQLAKNLFLSSERSLDRKIKEAFLALLLETRFTKREILKLYLDRAYLGGGAFGVEAASQFYFGKSVREVNLAEAALMAGLYKAPTKYAPHINLPASRARTNEVLQNLIEAGFYTTAQVHEARLHPAQIVETRATTSPDWFLDWAFEEVQRLTEGKNQYVLTARTTVDLAMQKQADEALVTFLKQRGRSLRINSGALVAMEPDGAVRALVGGPDYGESQFNRATHARRQPGSSFKIYVYAAALENGYKPDTVVRDASRSCGRWHPQNYGGSHGGGGRMPLWMALAKSLNTVAAELSFAVGREKVIELTQRLGITGIRKSCSMALGDYGITPLEHTGGLATFVNGGKSARPFGILDVVNSRGEMVYSRERDEPEPAQIVPLNVAEGMNQMMRRVVTDGTAQQASLDFTNVIGKTGTSSGPKDVWFVGATGKYVGSVWLGNDDNRPMAGGNTGGHLAAPLWHSFMSVAHRDMNIPNIPGLEPHPVQAAEAQRIAEFKRANPTAAADADGSKTVSPTMTAQARDALKRITTALRKAAGVAEPTTTPQPTPIDGRPAAPGVTPRGNRAERAPPLGSSSALASQSGAPFPPSPAGIP